MLRIYAIALASLAAVTMAAGAGGVRAGSMTAPSTGTVGGDWDIDTDKLGTATQQSESVGGDFFHVDWAGPVEADRLRVRRRGATRDGCREIQIVMLDAAGHEVESVLRPVRGLVPGKGRAYFDVSVPDAPSYRVSVASFELVELGPG